MCLLTNARCKTYQTVLSFRCLGHALGVGLHFFSPNSIRFGVCVTHMNGTCNGTILLVLGPLGGAKRSNIIKSQFQSQLQRFLNLTLCVFSQMKDIKHIRRDFHLITWVMHAPGFGTWVCLGSNI